MVQRIAVPSIDKSFQDDIDLASLIEQRSPTRFGKAAGNGKHRTVKGACPWCGGEDRFAVFVSERPQRYFCGIHRGSGCHKMGDPIQFIRDWDDLSFREAVAVLTGKDMPQVNHNVPLARAARGDWQSETWQKRALQFSVDAEKRLWADDGKGVLSYLLDRGFTEATIKGAHLGMALYKGSSIARDETEPAPCLVVPWFDRKKARYWRVELRDTRPGIDQKRRYESLPGSSVSDGLYGAQSFNRPVFLVEGAIDALSIAQEASDLAAVVATGSTGGSQNDLWLMRLANAPHVFVAFDADPQAEQSAAKWIYNLSNSTRWRTPIGKDANEMLVRGLSIRMWVEAALSTIEPEQAEPSAIPHDVCSICGIDIAEIDTATYDGDGTAFCDQERNTQLPYCSRKKEMFQNGTFAVDEPVESVEEVPEVRLERTTKEQFMSAVNRIADVFGSGCKITPIEKGYTLDQHIAKVHRGEIHPQNDTLCSIGICTRKAVEWAIRGEGYCELHKAQLHKSAKSRWKTVTVTIPKNTPPMEDDVERAMWAKARKKKARAHTMEWSREQVRKRDYEAERLNDVVLVGGA